MALNLYRRHRPGCEGGHPYDSRSGEFEEGKKSWRRCACPMFASGTLQAKFKRQTTGQNDWEAARAVAGQFEQAGIWGGSKPEPPPKPPSVEHENRTTIADACKLLLDKFAETAAFATHKKYRLLMARLVANRASTVAMLTIKRTLQNRSATVSLGSKGHSRSTRCSRRASIRTVAHLWT